MRPSMAKPESDLLYTEADRQAAYKAGWDDARAVIAQPTHSPASIPHHGETFQRCAWCQQPWPCEYAQEDEAVRAVIYDLARTRLIEVGWVTNPIPHEAGVRAALAGCWVESETP